MIFTTMFSIAPSYSQVYRAYQNHDLDDLEKLTNYEVCDDDDYIDFVQIRLLRGQCYEAGIFRSGQDLTKAYMDFISLVPHAEVLGSTPLTGAARCLRKLDAKLHRREILSLCIRAIRLDRSRQAMMIMGATYENTLLNRSRAKKLYLRAFCGGMPFGLRWYAIASWRDGNFVRSVLAHACITLLGPFFYIFGAPKYPYG